ncbi:GFA family protein [Pseudomonas putida]|uniref:GFA family protein n=1 Tax=Pseudomonas putida TaxID=303 RepID=A0A6I6XK49_PSEPU|nr:GFA family protein [Pseudomonas putida]QHG66091.1 GFA family protein [Pseudomonas putida]
MTEHYQGSCLCGGVRYELRTAPKAVSHCHCSQCRKGHGAAFASYGSVPRGAMRLLCGAEILRGYASSEAVRREFCSRCGSSLFWSRSSGEYSDWISIALGALDTPFRPGKQKHVHTGVVVGWCSLAG